MSSNNYLLIGLISISLFSCSSTKIINNSCYVKSSQKVLDRSIKPSNGTLNGLITGGVGGVIFGGFAGGLTGTALSVGTFGLYTPLIPGFIVAGAIGGGVIGGIIGGSVGYTYDYFNAGTGTYNYTIYCNTNIVGKYVEQDKLTNNKIESLIMNNDNVYNVIQISNKPFNNNESVVLKFSKDKLFIVGK
jgi:hypothetical protein